MNPTNPIGLRTFVPDTSIQQSFQQRIELALDVGHAFAGQVVEIEEGGVGQGVPTHVQVMHVGASAEACIKSRYASREAWFANFR